MSNTTIKDPLLEPYFIGKDFHCYTVYETVSPKKKRLGKKLEKGEVLQDYEKPQGHYSTFGSALQRIAKEKLNNGEENYSSVQEYVKKWDEILTQLKTLQNYKGL